VLGPSGSAIYVDATQTVTVKLAQRPQVLYWWPTPWRAVQEAAWRALNNPFAHDSSVVNESPP